MNKRNKEISFYLLLFILGLLIRLYKTINIRIELNMRMISYLTLIIAMNLTMYYLLKIKRNKHIPNNFSCIKLEINEDVTNVKDIGNSWGALINKLINMTPNFMFVIKIGKGRYLDNEKLKYDLTLWIWGAKNNVQKAYEIKAITEAIIPQLNAKILNKKQSLEELRKIVLFRHPSSSGKIQTVEKTLNLPIKVERDMVLLRGVEFPTPISRKKGIKIGYIWPGTKDYPVRIGLTDFLSHIAIFGRTGSGKSTTAKRIITNLWLRGIPSLILDYHNEYRDVVVPLGGEVFTPGVEISPLTINPLKIRRGIDVDEHIDFLIGIFEDTYSLTQPQCYLLSKALKTLYTMFDPEKTEPTLRDLVDCIKNLKEQSVSEYEIKKAILRRLEMLTRGQLGRILNSESVWDLERILDKPVSIELAHLRNDEHRNFLSYIILKLLYDYRVKKKSETLTHVTVIEEAEKLIRKKPEGQIGIGERVVSELRKFGEGFIIISQSPLNLPRNIIINTATKIVHTIGATSDARLLQGQLNLNKEQSTVLLSLPQSCALLKLKDQPEAYPVKIEPPKRTLKINDLLLRNLREEIWGSIN